MPALFTIDTGRGVRIPVTANAVLFGGAGALVPWPVKIKAFVLPPVELGVPAGLDAYNRRAVRDVGRTGPGPAPGRARSPGVAQRRTEGGVMMRRVLLTGAGHPVGAPRRSPG